MGQLTTFLENVAQSIKNMKGLASTEEIPASQFVDHIEVGEVKFSYEIQEGGFKVSTIQDKAGINNTVTLVEEKTLNEIDENFNSSNIANGVTIFGTTGNYSPPVSAESCKLKFATRYWHGDMMDYTKAVFHYLDGTLTQRSLTIENPIHGQEYEITVAKRTPIIVLADADICFGFGYSGTHQNLVVVPSYYYGVVCYCTGDVSGIGLTYND